MSEFMFDVVVIGSGPGGYVAAIRAAQLGLKTAIVEQYPRLGGTCLNVGCIPSKALLESSELYHQAHEGLEAHGVGLAGVTLDLAAMLARKDRVVTELTDGVAGLMKKNKVQMMRGVGSLVDAHTVKVTGDEKEDLVTARAVILASGSKAVELPFLPFDDERVVNSTGALCFEKVPEHLVVVGAGAVGLELGSVWRRLGARVTVVEMLPQITPFADKQLAKALQRSLKGQGLDIRLKARVTAAEVTSEGVTLTLEKENAEPETLTCDRVLVAVGRRPFHGGLGLEQAGVEMDGPMVKVNHRLETSLKGVYAIGDLVRGPMLAHKAEEEGVAVAERIAGKPGHVNYDVIPSIVYTHPELASVGLTEAQAKELGIKVRVGRFLYRANGRAKAMGAEEGMVKILADAVTDRLVGVHMVGARASEMIAEAVVAMEFAGSAEDLARAVHAHPTLSEIVKEAAMDVDGRAIHS